MKSKTKMIGLAIASVWLLLGIAQAQTIAYDTSVQPGNQGWPGNLGLDFDVNQAVVILKVGAFDSNGDGFAGSVQVAIFNRDTQLAVTPTVTFSGTTVATAGALINGNRFLNLPSPVILPPGHYSVVAVGYSSSDLNGNANVGSPFSYSTENTAAGLISFVGSGRYDANTSLDYPAIVPSDPSNLFNAGTFVFDNALTHIPKPPVLTSVFATPNGSGINITDTTSLTFTLMTQSDALTGIAFSDTLPAGLVVASPNVLTTVCGGAMLTAGGNQISVSGAALAAGTSCTISVNVTCTAGGTMNNITSMVTSNEAQPGAPASASLFVYDWWLWI